MKTLILILVLFSSSLFAGEKNISPPLHENTINYVSDAFNIFDRLKDLSDLDMYYLGKLLRGLNDYGFTSLTINYINTILDKAVKLDYKLDSPTYLLDHLVVAYHKEKGFDYAYNFALSFDGYSQSSVISALLYQVYKEKNVAKMIFLIENHKEQLTVSGSRYPQYREYDITYEKSLLSEVLYEENLLSGKLVLEEIKDIFFNIKLENMRPNHDALVDLCIKFKDVECIKRYIQKGNEFLSSEDHEFVFEYSIPKIILALIKLEEFKLVDEYLKKFVIARYIDESELQEIIELYPDATKVLADLMQADIKIIQSMFRITHLLKNYNTFDEEEKNLAYQELSDFIFKNKEIRDTAPGSSDSEKINLMYFNFAMQAMEFKNNELANLLAYGGAINTFMMLEDMTWDFDQLYSIIELLNNTENYEYAYELTSRYELDEGVKNYIYAKMARDAARSGDLEWAINANKAWLFYKDADPQIKKGWFKHKDSKIIYDKKLAVNLLINSSKTYLDTENKDEVKKFISELISSNINPEIFQWQSDEMMDFLEDLMANDLMLESIKFSKWYLDSYKISDNPWSSDLNLEEGRFDLVAKVFLGLLKKNDLTSAFFILKYIELDDSKKYSDIKDIEEKKENLLLQGARILNDPNIFQKYLEYFSVQQKFNLTVRKAITLNSW